MPKKESAKGSTFADRYQIIEKLGIGGMGEVYRALDNEINEDIAIKLIKPEIAEDGRTIERFRNELKVARKISHKNVCRMYHLAKEEETPYITMEYVEGEDLKSLTRKRGKFPEKEAIRLAQQVCDGLAEAHRLKVVHRDLKPQNIMIDKEGNAKIMDFGIARSVEAKGMTQTGMMIGTPAYISPEQAEGKEADQRSDIYSLGVILYEMVTGKVPFEGDTALSVALKHKTEAPSDPRELNDQLTEELSSVILTCLEKSPEARFQSVTELLSELRNIQEGLPLTTGIKRPPLPGFLIEGEEVEIERPIFVAREEELNSLGEFLSQALSGKGRVVFVKGEAGSGKTALVQEFARRAQDAHPELVVAGGNCNAHTGIGDPYLPFREALALLTGDVEGRWKAGSISSDHARRLWHCLPLIAQSLMVKGPELINTFIPGQELLSRAKLYSREASDWWRSLKELVERKAAIPSDASLQQSVLFKQFARVLEALADRKPVLLMLDDLQWADNGSVRLFMHLVEGIIRSQMLIVGAYRPEEVTLGQDGGIHPLKPVISECKARFGEIEIEVGQTGDQEFVNAYLDTEPNKYSASFRESFLKHTAGNSLFTTEVLRGLKEQEALIQDKEGRWMESKVDWEKLPTRVEAVIGQRIDRLPESLRKAMTLASVEGEYFTLEVLARVLDADEHKTVELLSGELDKRYQLVKAQGIQHAGGQRLSQYRFRHILFQKYLYNSIDEVERAHQHEDVGNVLERLYGENAGEIAAQLARHFQEAGLTEKAIHYLQQAAAKAVQLSANNEAVAHFSRALELLTTFPDTPERVPLELALQLGLASPLVAVRGWTAPGLFDACARAHELCSLIGETPQMLQALYFLSCFHFMRAEYDMALEMATQALSIAERFGDPLAIALAHWPMGYIHVFIGDFNKALEHCRQVLDFYNPSEHGLLGFFYGQDPGMSCRKWAAIALWALGYPDQALKQSQEALALVQEFEHPFTFCAQFFMSAQFDRLCRDIHAYKSSVNRYVELAIEGGFETHRTWGIFDQGHLEVEFDHVEKGIEKMRQGLTELDSFGDRLQRPYHLALLSEALCKSGNLREALEEMSKAQAQLEKSGEGLFEAEIHRLKGEILLMKKGAEEEAEASFHRAIEVAQKQQAKSWELRATMSLARLWKKQGKTKEARKRLVEICGWFTEGFNTPDLKDAKALLEELE